MPIIRPEPDRGPEMARALLALADDPREVGVTTDGGLGFVVPEALEERWLASLRVTESKPEPKPVVVQQPDKSHKAVGRPRRVRE